MTDANDRTLVDAALSYAGRGWPVFPVHGVVDGHCMCLRPDCRPVGKHPQIVGWPVKATTEESAIRRWWQGPANANVGIVTGRRSGIVALDIDARRDGEASLASLEREHGSLPRTVEVATGGGGRHVYMARPDEEVRTRAAIVSGIDVRGEGGFIVAPPSVHRSGQRYTWRVDTESAGPLASVPEWLLRLLRNANARNQVGGTWERPIPEGRRNDTLASMAGALRARGLTPAAIEVALLVQNEECCLPPLPVDEVRAIARGMKRYPPVPSFRGI